MKGGYMPKKEKENKSKIEEDLDLYKDYEPDGRDLAEHLRVQEEWKKENPNANMKDAADYYAELQGEIKRGK